MKLIRIYLPLLLLSLGLLSCEDNLDLLDHYKLSGDIAPITTLSSASTAVYTDIYNTKKEFSIDYNERIVKKASDGDKYATEEISADLRNPNETYHLTIQLTADKKDDIYTEYVVARLFTRAGYIVIPTITINQNGDAIQCEKLGTITLNNSTFPQVYRNSKNVNIPFQYIYYNQEQGIVGFHDESGKIWTLKHYK